VRRRILELLASGEMSSGAACEVIREEFGISQRAVSAQLRVLPRSWVRRRPAEGEQTPRRRQERSAARGWRLARSLPPFLGSASRRLGDRGGARAAQTPNARSARRV